MLQKFILNLLIEAAKNPEVQKFVDDRIEKLKDDLLPELIETLLPSIAGLLPSFGGSILKTFMDLVPNLPNIDDLPGAVSDVAENIIESTPDFDLPIVSDAVERLTGIDVTEAIKGVLRGFLR
jgi:hypothetical protein